MGKKIRGILTWDLGGGYRKAKTTSQGEFELPLTYAMSVKKLNSDICWGLGEIGYKGR